MLSIESAVEVILKAGWRLPRADGKICWLLLEIGSRHPETASVEQGFIPSNDFTILPTTL